MTKATVRRPVAVRSDGRGSGSGSGLFVVVCGPDGTGKSTLSRALSTGPNDTFVSARVMHWRPHVLPRLGALIGRPAPDGRRPHAARPYGPIVSVLRLLYYWMDHLVGHRMRIHPLRRDGVLVILERGIWDMAVDPHRYRLGIRPGLISALARLVPEPDLTLVLLGASSAIVGRKRELPVDELDRQMRRWRELARSHDRWYVLDAARPPETILADASRLIADPRRDRAVDA